MAAPWSLVQGNDFPLIMHTGLLHDECLTSQDSRHQWSQYHSVKELQRFLGFAHFYGIFIEGFSSETITLTSLQNRKVKTYRWIDRAFKTLEAFYPPATAILAHL